MGKGAGGCVARAAISLQDGIAGSGHASQQAVPGKSHRAQETFKLLQEAGQFTTKYLLRDLSNPQSTVKPSLADADDMTHNALMQWIPSSYQGHAGYVEEHQQLGQELLYTIMLDGDRKANHLYFYKDRRMNAVWTLGSAASARGWYKLPHDGNGNLVAQGLADAVKESMNHPEGSFLQAMVKTPMQTMAMSVDVHEKNVSTQDFMPHFAMLSQECRQALGSYISKEPSVPSSPLKHLKIKTALLLAYQEQLSQLEKNLLLHAVALSPDWNCSVEDSLKQTSDPKLQQLLLDIAPTQSVDDYPMMNPQTKLGKILADVQQSWMASTWCDWGIYQWQQNFDIKDNAQNLDTMRNTIPRTPWHTAYGRKKLSPVAKTQESRLRALIGLSKGGIKLGPALKGAKQLVPKK